MNWKVPLFDLDIGKEEIEAISRVIDSKWISMGQVTREFEREFAQRHGAKHGIAVCNCTAALHLALKALGIGKGDEVICPSLTFVATANSILYTGATPVFADIVDKDNLNVSPYDIESKINEKTKVILVVHYAGFPCDMDRIMEIARKYNLFVIEDAAHAPGAEYYSKKRKGKREKVGTIGDIGCFSFFSNKNMTTGEGGMVVTNNDEFADKIRIMRSHGMTSLTWDRYKGLSYNYDVIELGFNYRMDEMRAALGLVQLKKLDKNNERRKKLWKLYKEKLNDIEEVNIPFLKFSGISSYHIFPILLSQKINREDFIQYLRTKGIQTSIHYPPIHLFSYYKKLLRSNDNLPLTEYVGRKEVTLPLFPAMREDDVDYIVKSVKNYLKNSKSF